MVVSATYFYWHGYRDALKTFEAVAERLRGAEIMEISSRFARPALALAAAASSLVVLATPGSAQIGAYVGSPGSNLQGSHAPPSDTLNTEDLKQQQREQAEHAVILGDWLIFPSAFVGGIYDTNPGQASSGAKATAGARLVINGLAERNTGISKTDLYGMVDGRFYTNGAASISNIATAQFGGIETFTPVPDWTLTGQGDFTRQRDLFDSLGVDHSVTTLNTTGVGVAPTTNPEVYNQLTGAGAAEKRFGRAFVRLGGSLVAQVYDQTSTNGNSNNVVYTGTARGGFWLTPDIYGFVEGSGDSRNYDASISNSNGYRVITGVGTGRIGLMQGEVYVGYQAELFQTSTVGTNRGPAFGGQLDYTPLPELDFKIGVDRTIGATQVSAIAAASTTVTDVLGVVSYALAPEWSASGRAGYIHTDYKGFNRTDDSWTIGPSLTYSVWRNFGLTVDYQHIQSASNVSFDSFSRDVVSVGVTYKY
jgi:hypothetical protein